jgi:hypothetical protein
MNERTTRISNFKMIYSKEGYISYRHSDDIYFKICKLTYELFENEEYHYLFEPYYDVLDAFDGLEIPGIDLSLREPLYVRANLTPVFVTERVLPKNRVNFHLEIQEYQVDHYQPMLLMLDSKKTYSGDRLSLKSEHFYDMMATRIEETADLYKLIPAQLRKLASRSPMVIGTLVVTNENRANLIKNYLFLYEKVSNHFNQKSAFGRGRQKQSVAFVVLREVHSRYTQGFIDIDEAVKQSGLGSKRTYYRRIKELQESEKANQVR